MTGTCGHKDCRESRDVTPIVVLVRGFFDDIKRFMLEDVNIGRDSKQRNFTRSRFFNPYRVVQYGRD